MYCCCCCRCCWGIAGWRRLVEAFVGTESSQELECHDYKDDDGPPIINLAVCAHKLPSQLLSAWHVSP